MRRPELWAAGEALHSRVQNKHHKDDSAHKTQQISGSPRKEKWRCLADEDGVGVSEAGTAR